MSKLNITKEKPNEIQQIHKINLKAFETDAEADLVDRLRNSGIPIISLVAEIDEKLVGHILFTPMTIPILKLPVWLQWLFCRNIRIKELVLPL